MLALGLYAKYTFLFFVAGIVLASLTIKAYREAMFDRRLFISILIPVVTVFPHAVWVLNHWEVVWGNIAFKAGVHQPRSILHIPMGVLNFVQNSFFMLVLFFLVVFGVFRPKWQSISGNELLRFIERFFIAIGLLFAAQIVLGGTHRFHERWLQPFALVVPLWVFLRLESLELSAERLRRFVMCGVIVLVGITGARASQIWLGGSDGGRNLLQMNYIPLTEELAKLDAANATLLAGDRVLAGHLALHFPKATVISLERRGYQPTIDPTRPIIAVWHHELGVDNSLFIGLWLKELFGEFRFAEDIRHAKVPPLLSRRHTNEFAFVKVEVP